MKKMTLRGFLASMACTALLLGVAGQAQAAIIAYQVPTGTVGNQAWTGSLGMDFNVNTSVVVSALGVFDSGSDGWINGGLTVQLYDRSGTPTVLASVVFSQSNQGTLIGGSRFLPITPVALPAGFQGSIVAFGFNSVNPNYNQGIAALPGLTTNSGGGALSFVGGGRFAAPGDTSFPTMLDGGPANRYAAGTFKYAPVPEPGTLLLIGSGLVGIGVGARRRRK